MKKEQDKGDPQKVNLALQCWVHIETEVKMEKGFRNTSGRQPCLCFNFGASQLSCTLIQDSFRKLQISCSFTPTQSSQPRLLFHYLILTNPPQEEANLCCMVSCKLPNFYIFMRLAIQLSMWTILANVYALEKNMYSIVVRYSFL